MTSRPRIVHLTRLTPMSPNSFLRALLPAVVTAAVAAGPARAQIADSAGERMHATFAKACAGPASRIWGQPVCGPLLLVDRSTRRAFANVPLTEDGFTKVGTIYAGRWPDTATTANTAILWRGERISVVGLPIADDDYLLIALLAHESFHRIQPALGLTKVPPVNPHMEERDGRLWLRLELRALSYALTSSGADRARHARNAMLFRRYRQSLFPGADTLERDLEVQEGLAEYTGQRVALAATGLGRLRVVRAIDSHVNDPSYARSFAYATGPALGLLLDDFAPGWQRGIRTKPDPGRMLASALGVTGSLPPAAMIVERARPYGYDALLRFETGRATERAARIAEYRKRFVDGPVLELVQPSLGTTYDPLTLFPFDTLGTVYPTGIFQAEWGRLQVDTLGALIATDFRRARVAAPASPEGATIAGPGWTLQLNDGWVLVAGARAGDFLVRRRQP